MLKGIHLTLMIGVGMPKPVPQVVMDALSNVSVTSGRDKGGFQISFTVSKNSPILTEMLPHGYFEPIVTRVIIVATLNGHPNVLMDGMITNQEFSPSNEPGQSTLTITGSDMSLAMDLVEMPFMRYPAMPEIAQVYAILAKYALLGIEPLAIPPFINVPPIPTERIPTQTTTDLVHLRKLAREVGYVFYVEPGPVPGMNIAYWGPDIRIPVPQPALNVNMDAHTNVESLSVSVDGLAKKIMVFGVFDPVQKKIPIPIPLPNFNIFKPPLGAQPLVPAKVEFPDWSYKEDAPKIVNRILGALAESSDAISVSGSLDVLRYGHILRARMLVGVRGASATYDGLYYVNSVTHTIQRGQYKQSFQLSRDGLTSLTSKVPV
ncbi:MAG: hypothetical protein HYZ45_10665 [Burkholderiales bacterium]|nr:hypothetical protein [Burkholderiales bacterium]